MIPIDTILLAPRRDNAKALELLAAGPLGDVPPRMRTWTAHPPGARPLRPQPALRWFPADGRPYDAFFSESLSLRKMPRHIEQAWSAGQIPEVEEALVLLHRTEVVIEGMQRLFRTAGQRPVAFDTLTRFDVPIQGRTLGEMNGLGTLLFLDKAGRDITGEPGRRL